MHTPIGLVIPSLIKQKANTVKRPDLIAGPSWSKPGFHLLSCAFSAPDPRRELSRPCSIMVVPSRMTQPQKFALVSTGLSHSERFPLAAFPTFFLQGSSFATLMLGAINQPRPHGIVGCHAMRPSFSTSSVRRSPSSSSSSRPSLRSTGPRTAWPLGCKPESKRGLVVLRLGRLKFGRVCLGGGRLSTERAGLLLSCSS